MLIQLPDSLRLQVKKSSLLLAPLTYAVTLGLVTSPNAPLYAQQAENTLEEVVVTARRREESLQDVPVAISVLNSDFMQEANVLDNYNLYAETPGMEWNQSRDRLGSRPNIRGVATTSQSILQQKVGAFVDGAPILGNTASLQFTDLERIEVLRGPQSSAFGRSTFAGALNYVTRDPGEEHRSTFKATTSDLGRNILGASFDGPITDTLGYTFDIYSDEFEGPDEWISTDGVRTGGTASDYIAGKLKWAPSDRFDMEVRVALMEQADDPTNETNLTQASRDACVNTVLPNGDGYIIGDFNCDISDKQPRRNHDLTVGFTPGTPEWDVAFANSVLDPAVNVETTRIQAEFNFPQENGSLLQVITSYHEEESNRWHDQDQVAVPAVPNTMNFSAGMGVQVQNSPRERDETYLDVRWLSPGDNALRWLVGASVYEFDHADASFRQWAANITPDVLERLTGGVPFRPQRRQNALNTATGVYGNITYDVSDRTTLSFEGRFQRDDRVTREPLSGRTVPQVTDSFQPRFAINHTLNDDWSIYGQLSQGTNPATSNPVFADSVIIASINAARAGGVITYDENTFLSAEEEQLTNAEFGIKGTAMDGRLQLAAAVYVMDWKDQILGAAFDWEGADPVNGSCAGVPDCWNDGSFDPNGTIFGPNDTASGMVFINRGDGDLKGLEVEATWLANDNWSIRAALTLQDNTYARNCDQEPVDDMGFTPTSTIADDGVLFDCFDVSGNHIEQTSEEQLALSATYRSEFGASGWSWLGRLGLRYEGDKYVDIMNFSVWPAVTTFNGQVSFTNENWEIILFGNNLSDEDAPRQLRSLFNDRSIPGDNYNYLQRIPREIGLRLNYAF